MNMISCLPTCLIRKIALECDLSFLSTCKDVYLVTSPYDRICTAFNHRGIDESMGLLRAIKHQDADFVFMMLENGHDVGHALLYTIILRRIDIARMILQKGFVISRKQFLVTAVAVGNCDIVQLLVDKYEPNNTNHLVLISVINGHVHIVRFLLERFSYDTGFLDTVLRIASYGYMSWEKYNDKFIPPPDIDAKRFEFVFSMRQFTEHPIDASAYSDMRNALLAARASN